MAPTKVPACSTLSMAPSAGGRKAIIFGGEGYMLDDTGEGSSPCVYIFDADLLTWTQSATHAPGEGHNPGARSLHVTTVGLRPTSSIAWSISSRCNESGGGLSDCRGVCRGE